MSEGVGVEWSACIWERACMPSTGADAEQGMVRERGKRIASSSSARARPGAPTALLPLSPPSSARFPHIDLL
jgi:hypothetical protein